MSTADLDGFRSWLVRRGRDPGTARLYSVDVGAALRAKNGPASRLVDRSLAPKTRRHILAALRSWADFTSDGELLLELKGIKLPAPQRITVKKPMTEAEWFRLIDAIDTAKLEEPLRAVLGIMAVRGLRCGDVLRLEPKTIRSALESGELVYEAKGGRWLTYSVADKTLRRYLKLLADTKNWKRVEDLVSPRAEEEMRREVARRRVQRHLRRVALEVGLKPADIYTHRLRRTYAVHFLKAMEGDPQALQKLQAQMQWANPNTLFEYTDYVTREELDEIGQRMMKRRK